MSKAIIKRAVKKALQETKLFTHIKVWDIKVDVDYKGQDWLKIECSANTKQIKRK